MKQIITYINPSMHDMFKFRYRGVYYRDCTCGLTELLWETDSSK